jgi:hypothetical protein
LADKSTQLILDALSRAAAEPAGLPLHGGKASPGLFSSTALGRQAAQRCKEEGYLRVVRTDTRGKTTQEICTLTGKGLSYLIGQVSPKQVLEDLVRTLEARQGQFADLVSAAQQTREHFSALRSTTEKVLGQVSSNGPVFSSSRETPSDAWLAEALAHLSRWQAAGASEDCPLPDLYRQARQTSSQLTIGQFHDGLRRLHDQHQIYLHPWTGPLYDLPEPPYALLIGHEVAYYASVREQESLNPEFGTNNGETAPWRIANFCEVRLQEEPVANP